MKIAPCLYPSAWKHGLLVVLPSLALVLSEMNTIKIDLEFYGGLAMVLIAPSFLLSFALHAARFITKVNHQPGHPLFIFARWCAILGQASLAAGAMLIGIETDGAEAGAYLASAVLLALAVWYVIAWMIQKVLFFPPQTDA